MEKIVNAKDVDFTVKKFEINEYRVLNHIKLKITPAPVKFFRTTSPGIGGYPTYSVFLKPVSHQYVLNNTTEGPDINIKTYINKDIPFITISEPWNVYQLSDGTSIKVKLVVQNIKLIDEVNQFGEPVFTLSVINQLSPKIPKKLKLN